LRSASACLGTFRSDRTQVALAVERIADGRSRNNSVLE
jgi:hypothetical protein